MQLQLEDKEPDAPVAMESTFNPAVPPRRYSSLGDTRGEPVISLDGGGRPGSSSEGDIRAHTRTLSGTRGASISSKGEIVPPIHSESVASLKNGTTAKISKREQAREAGMKYFRENGYDSIGILEWPVAWGDCDMFQWVIHFSDSKPSSATLSMENRADVKVGTPTMYNS